MCKKLPQRPQTQSWNSSTNAQGLETNQPIYKSTKTELCPDHKKSSKRLY